MTIIVNLALTLRQAVKISLQLKHPDKAEAYAAISTKAFYYQA